MRTHICHIALICFLTIFLFALATEGNTPHDPILISSDTAPDKDDGIKSGSGLIDDPYIISGWSIEVQSDAAIEIRAPSAYIIIRDCEIIGSGNNAIGVLLNDASHVRITNCELRGLKTGIFVYQSPGITASKNQISSCMRGIEATESDGAIIDGNSITDVNKQGIFLWRCHLASLSGNIVRACRDGIYLDSCHNNTVRKNRVKDLNHGIFLWDSFDCEVVENIIEGCELGLAVVHTSERNTIFHNSFLNNTRPASCDSSQNFWDNGYPAGGNFWHGQPAVDMFSGEDQNQPGFDGISDNPVKIPFQNLDRYPLMEQPVDEPRG